MRGFRQRSSGILALVVVSLLTLGLVAFAETTHSSGEIPSPTSVESSNANPSQKSIQARIQELQELSIAMDAVRANLTKVAERALQDSDSAPTLTERRRYEQLYAETNARLGELQTTRAEITHLLNTLEVQLEALKNAQ